MKIVKNEETGQAITENVLCRPTDKDTIKLYEKNGVDIDKLPKCENFTPLSNYEGLWTSIFVKPLAWVIIQIGKLVNNYGLAIILACALIRGILLPITKKTAMQTEMMKQAQPELKKLEKKYYTYHTGHIGGLKSIQYKSLMANKADFVVYEAVKGMLPHNKLGAKMIKKLRVVFSVIPMCKSIVWIIS